MLALWEFNWTWGASPSPTPTPTATGNANAGGGGQHYAEVGEDFWLVRERYLRRYLTPAMRAEAESPALPATAETGATAVADETAVTGAILLMRQALSAALKRAEAARSEQELRDAMARAFALSLDISKIRQQYYNRAIALLLLDVL